MEFEIVEHIKVLETYDNGWTLELNRVSWYGKEARLEIRPWNSDHTKCGKGCAVSDAALETLRVYLNDKCKEVV